MRPGRRRRRTRSGLPAVVPGVVRSALLHLCLGDVGVKVLHDGVGVVSLGLVRVQQVSQVLEVSDHVRNEAGTADGTASLFKW